jgi:hypothetical protein
MTTIMKKITKGIVLNGESSDLSDNLEGSLFHNKSTARIKSYIQGAVREVLTNSQSQVLTNKTIAAVDNTIVVASSNPNLTSTGLNAALSELQDHLDSITDVSWTGDYDNGRTYTVGEGVMFNGASFRMIIAIGAAGYNPVAYPANWLQVTDYVSANAIGLGNVTNTSDADKPVSSATQTALNGKANSVHTHVAADITDFNSAVDARIPDVVLDSDDVEEGTTNLYFTNERVDDRVKDLLVAGSGVSLTYDDIANTLTVVATSTAGGGGVPLWEALTNYTVNEVIVELPQNKIYIAGATHTSSTDFITDLTIGGLWTEVSAGGITPWASGIFYNLNDLMIYTNIIYICTGPHTSSGMSPAFVNWAQVSGSAGDFVLKTGDTMTGALLLTNPFDTVTLDAQSLALTNSSSGMSSLINRTTATYTDIIGTTTTEGMLGAGSLNLMSIDTLSGDVTSTQASPGSISLQVPDGLGGSMAPLPTVPGQLTTKRYVDEAVAAGNFIPLDAFEFKKSLIPIVGVTPLFTNGFGASGTTWAISTGTQASRIPTAAAGSVRSRMVRSSLSSSAAFGSSCGLSSLNTSPLCSMTSGWRLRISFGFGDLNFNTTTKSFIGVISGGAPVLGTPSSLLNMIGIGNDSDNTGAVKDLNLQIMCNDGTGTATKIDLGTNFPANRTSGAASQDWYVFDLYNDTGTNTVKYKVRNCSNGETAQGILSSNLPDSTVLLGATLNRSCGSSSIVHTIEFGEIAVWTN